MVVSLSLVSCLNPYSNGICSLSKDDVAVYNVPYMGLNPYSNGICSLRK